METAFFALMDKEPRYGPMALAFNQLRSAEYPRLDRDGRACLNYNGAGLFSQAQMVSPPPVQTAGKGRGGKGGGVKEGGVCGLQEREEGVANARMPSFTRTDKKSLAERAQHVRREGLHPHPLTPDPLNPGQGLWFRFHFRCGFSPPPNP